MGGEEGESWTRRESGEKQEGEGEKTEIRKQMKKCVWKGVRYKK